LGAALAAKDHSLAVASWGVGQSADRQTLDREVLLERSVSRHIGKMQLLWLAVGDPPSPSSDRAYLERNLIGLVAGREVPVDAPSLGWLGLYSPDRRIRDSGLWNLDFLTYNYSSEFLDVLAEYVQRTISARMTPSHSIAPHDWYTKAKEGGPSNQMSLFPET
jgi:hypothetical protein